MATVSAASLPDFSAYNTDISAAITALTTLSSAWSSTTVAAANQFLDAMKTGTTAVMDRYTSAFIAALPTAPVIDPLPSGTYDILPALTLTSAGTAVGFSSITVPSITDITSGAGLPTTTGSTVSLWTGADWGDLKTQLTNMIDNISGTTNILTAVSALSSETSALQVALYQQDYERRTQALRDAFSAADTSTGARGFSYPNSMTIALKLEAQKRFLDEMNETGRQITKMVFEWAKSNYQFSIQQGISAHNSDVEFNMKYIETGIKVYNAKVTALLEKYKQDLTTAIQQADIKIKEYAEQFKQEVERFKVYKDERARLINLNMEQAKTSIHMEETEYRTRILAWAEQIKIAAANANAQIQSTDISTKTQLAAAEKTATIITALTNTVSNIALNIGTA